MARFIRFAACQSSALPEAKASDTIRTKISIFRYKIAVLGECLGDNALLEKPHESISRDHLSEQPVLRQLAEMT